MMSCLSILTGLESFLSSAVTAWTPLAIPRRHGVRAGRDVLEPQPEDLLGQHRRRGRPVAGYLAGLAGGLFDQLGPHVLVLVLQLDLLGHRHAVFRYRRRAPPFVDDCVPSAWTEGAADRGGEFFHSSEQALACVLLEGKLLSRHEMCLLLPSGPPRLLGSLRPVRLHPLGSGQPTRACHANTVNAPGRPPHCQGFPPSPPGQVMQTRCQRAAATGMIVTLVLILRYGQARPGHPPPGFLSTWQRPIPGRAGSCQCDSAPVPPRARCGAHVQTAFIPSAPPLRWPRKGLDSVRTHDPPPPGGDLQGAWKTGRACRHRRALEAVQPCASECDTL